jgi:transposase, IS30 family
MSYHHLSQNERYQIYALKRAGLTITQIANELSRCASTISREFARGAGARGYRADQAQRLAQARAEGSRNARRIIFRVRLELSATLNDRVVLQLISELKFRHISISLGYKIGC